MSASTSIEWVRNADGTQGRTWNPITGCDRVSPGCDHCYALTLAARLKAMGSRRYQLDGHPLTSGPGFGLQLHHDLVAAPRRWRKPAVVFVNSMSDLFHERIPFDFLRAVFATMEATPQHTYQVLTKRATHLTRVADRLSWPPNVWMGVTVENQDQVERRARRLLRVPAAVRFLSIEPMIGPVDISRVLAPHWTCPACGFDHWSTIGAVCVNCRTRSWPPPRGKPAIHWVIVGGESGPRARPMDLAWARDVVAQCRGAGVAPFVKQLGSVWAGARKGGDIAAWPEDLQVREMPAAYHRRAEDALFAGEDHL